MKYVLLTLGIEAVLFLTWVFFEAKRQIKEEESGRFWPPDFFDR
jgi:hypothetical protein